MDKIKSDPEISNWRNTFIQYKSRNEKRKNWKEKQKQISDIEKSLLGESKPESEIETNQTDEQVISSVKLDDPSDFLPSTQDSPISVVKALVSGTTSLEQIVNNVNFNDKSEATDIILKKSHTMENKTEKRSNANVPVKKHLEQNGHRKEVSRQEQPSWQPRKEPDYKVQTNWQAKKATQTNKIHPSWQAKKEMEDKLKTIRFEGKKKTFDD